MGLANINRTFLALLICIYSHVWTCKGVELLEYLRNIGTPAAVYYNGTVVQYSAFSFNPENAIDGVTGDPDLCNCCAALNRPSYIRIDLRASYNFSRIVVYGRTGDREHTSDCQNKYSYAESFPIAGINGIFELPASDTLHDVQTITLYATDYGIMTICEVKIFQPEINITSQSSTYGNCHASNAVNNVPFSPPGTNDDILCNACSVTNNDTNPWWELDLGVLTLLGKIDTFGRTDGGSSQSSNIELQISNTTLRYLRSGTFANNSSTSSLTSIFEPPRLARYINIKHTNAGYNFLTICQVFVYAAVCPKEKYGDLCSRTCHCKGTCGFATGQCSACLSGWTSARCDEACVGTYGDNCSKACSWHCRDNETCNHVDGHCTNGCQPGYYYADQTCTTACVGTYGDNCTKACSWHCRDNETCNHVDGHCTNGCQPGYYYADQTCTTACVGTYGDNCTKACSWHCRDNETCNHVDGHCTNGCQPGYYYADQTCTTACVGTYGDNCTKACSWHCRDNETCNHVDGHCTNGCQPGYYYADQTCTAECGPGYFGVDCVSECHCRNSSTCNHFNGSCADHVCAAGWTSDNCSRVCHPAHFGIDCMSQCHCLDNESCHYIYGHCSNRQCSAGWIGDNCSIECMARTYGENCSKECNCEKCHHVNGSCVSTKSCFVGFSLGLADEICTKCNPGWYGDNCSKECHCDECHNVNGSCSLSTRCHEGFHFQNGLCKADDIKSTSAAAVGGGVGAAVSVIVAFAVVVILIRRRHKFRKQAKQHDAAEMTDISQKSRSSTGQDNDAFSDAVNNVYESPENPYYSFKDAVPGIKVHLLWDFIREKTKSGSSYFADEFSKLPTGLINKHDVASLPENRGKNRYREMFAYDHSRVPLTKDKQTDSEYINACFIHGFGKVNKFIASQGPTEKMIDDFWRMIWQQRVEKIAMLTNLIELGTLKCLQYWPEEIGSATTFGDVNVTYIGTEDTYDYNIRTFNIKKGQETRRVKQFHFKTWNDKGVPDTTWCLLDFWRAVDTNDSTNTTPIVVHCSAGVGRTGTFIALDNLIIQGRLEGSVRPFPMVEALRQQRVSMVQTKDQYVYLHEALAEALLMGTHHVLTRQFESVYTNMLGKEKGSYIARVDEQFDLIVRSVEESALKVDEQAHASSEPMYGNIDIDAYRPQLLKRGSKFTQQLGALFIPAFNTTNALLVCMSPTDQHLEEFWSLVDEHHVTTVINLSAPGCAAYGSCQYLGGRGSGRVGKFSVNYIHEKRNNSTVERSFSFRDENHEDEDYLTTIKQFQVTSWLEGHDTPPDIRSFQDLIEEVLKWQPHLSDNRPILIHCQTGFIRCGLVAVVLNEIQRIRKANGQINIVESVKTMKTRFRDFVHSKEQYRFCYEAILSYVQNSGNYQSL